MFSIFGLVSVCYKQSGNFINLEQSADGVLRNLQLAQMLSLGIHLPKIFEILKSHNMQIKQILRLLTTMYNA